MGVPLRRKTPKKKDYWYIIEHVILNLQLGNLNVYRCNSNLEEMIVWPIDSSNWRLLLWIGGAEKWLLLDELIIFLVPLTDCWF